MSYAAFSPKQRMALTWWMPGSGESHREAIVCDGAVRSGKTMAMGLGFFLWAMMCFDGQRFGVCGKTVGSLRRNVLAEILPKLAGLGFTWKERRSENLLTVRFRGGRISSTSSAAGTRARPASFRASPLRGSCWMRWR